MNSFFETLKRLKDEAYYRSLVKSFKTLDYFREANAKNLFLPLMEDIPPGKKILILAPHFDDEVFACGGTIALLNGNGASTTSVYFTDGSEGGHLNESKEELTNKRKEEAKQAAAILGIKELIFLDHPDRKLKATEFAIKQFSELLKKHNPDTVMLPFYVDYHPDHQAVFKIASAALPGFNAVDCYCYETAVPIIPNRIIDIGKTVELKRDAMACFKSQAPGNDYINSILEGLNRFRTYGLMKGSGYAEAFFKCSPEFLGRLLDV